MRYVQTTHEVTNQPVPLEDYDVYGVDLPLREIIAREAAPWVAARLAAYGPLVGSAALIELGFQANRFPPELRTHDRFGHRIDEVTYHPAYHALMGHAMQHDLHAVAWQR